MEGHDTLEQARLVTSGPLARGPKALSPLVTLQGTPIDAGLQGENYYK